MSKLPLGRVVGTVVAAIVIFVITSLWLDLNEQKIALNEAIQILQSQSWVLQELSGTVNELTIVEEPEAELTIEEAWVEEVSSVLACSPGEQPTQHASDWTGNSEILNTWSAKNPCVLPKGSYSTITFELAKPIGKANELHTRFKDTGIYGKVLVAKGEQTIQLDINSITTTKVVGGDLGKYLEKNDVSLSTYIAMFDGNYIVAIYLD